MDTIAQTQQKIEQILKEANPEIDLSPGSVISELLCKLFATANNTISNNIQDLSQAKNVQQVVTATTDTYSDVISSWATNFNVGRINGTKSSGNIKVTVLSKKLYFFNTSTGFFQSSLNKTYYPIANFTVDPSATTSNDTTLQFFTERLPDNSTQYYFIVPVIAEKEGADYQVSQGTRFVISGVNTNITYKTAEAYGAFSAAVSTETDADLISRYKLGLSVKNLTSTYSINSVLKEMFPTFVDSFVVGANDPELVRAKQNLLGVSIPGMADVYVRTAAALTTTTVVLTGTCTNYLGLGQDSVWSINIAKDVAPGFYRIAAITPVDQSVAGTLVINNINYGIDLNSSNNRSNDIPINQPELARYTRYQTATVTFTHNGLGTSNGAGSYIANFVVTLLTQPNIADIQDVFLSSDKRIVCADYLVKAVIPCQVSLDLKLHQAYKSETLPVDKIKADIFNYINSISLGEELMTSKIIDICHNYKITHVDMPIFIKGIIMTPSLDDKNIEVNGDTSLSIPTSIIGNQSISSSNTAFFISNNDISIEVL